MFQLYDPKLRHFVLPALFVIGGGYAARFGGWWIVTGLLLILLAWAASTFIVLTAQHQGRTEFARAVAEVARQLAPLDEDARRALGFRFPEIELYARMGKPNATIGGVSLDWFRDIFMAGSNTISTLPLRNLTGPGRDQDRSNWYAVTAYLSGRGMFLSAPRGSETYRWRPGAYEFCTELAGYQQPLPDWPDLLPIPRSIYRQEEVNA